MRTIHTDEITKCIKEMCMQVNVDLSPDVKDALLAGKEKEESTIGKQILEQLEKNLEIAKESQIPICQDTGMTVVFLRIGQEVHIDGDFLEDAVNEGVVAIIKGIDMYDPDKNIKFSTYITTRVRGAMLDYVRKQEWMPRGFYKQLGIIESACEDMKRELGRTPTVDELAKHLGIEKKRCQRIISMKNRRNIQSLDFLLENQNTSNGLQITNNDTQVQPEEACLWEEDMRVLAEGIAQLNEKEQKTLALHYMEGLKMEQVGRVIGVSQPRASQIHTIALRKLRHFIETKNGKGIKSDVSGIL